MHCINIFVRPYHIIRQSLAIAGLFGSHYLNDLAQNMNVNRKQHRINKNTFILLILLLLCSCTTVPPQKPTLDDVTVEKINGRPYIWATLNGKRYQFMLDTGSTGFLLTEQMVQEAGLVYSKNNSMKAHGITGVINLKTIDKATLLLDNRVVVNISNVAVINKNGLGLFPYEFLEALDVVWDVNNNKLIFKKDISKNNAPIVTAQ